MPETLDTLNRVLAILERSFPQYMSYARPYVPAGREDVMRTIQDIVAGENALAERVSQMITEGDGLPDAGDFPIDYTDSHDLAIDYMVREAIANQKQDIADLERCVDDLRMAPAAQSLVAEALGMAKAHLELLKSLEERAGQSTIVHDRATAFANDVPPSNEETGAANRQDEQKTLAGDPQSPG